MAYAFMHKSSQTVLIEASARQLQDLQARDDGHSYWYCSAPSAHKWVREGGQHETPLYLDGNRIRYARG